MNLPDNCNMWLGQGGPKEPWKAGRRKQAAHHTHTRRNPWLYQPTDSLATKNSLQATWNYKTPARAAQGTNTVVGSAME